MKKFSMVIMMMLCAFVTNANAALISWTAEVFTAASQVSTNGSLIEAFNFNGTNVTVNTVAFEADPNAGNVTGADTDHLVVGPFKVTGRVIVDTATVYEGAVTEMDRVLDTFRGNTREANTGFQLTDLTVGQEYEVQIWMGDARTAATRNRYMTIDGTRVPSSGAWDTSMYIATGTFTADAATQDFTLAGFNNADDAAVGTQLPAFQLRAISSASTPEIGNVHLDIIGTDAVVTFQGVVGLDYTLQRKLNLASSEGWSNVVSGITGVGGMQSISNSMSEGMAFYRIVSGYGL